MSANTALYELTTGLQNISVNTLEANTIDITGGGNLTVESLTIAAAKVTQYILPTASGLDGSVLTYNAAGKQCSWTAGGGPGGVNSVAATALPIVVAGTAAEPTVGFDATGTALNALSLTAGTLAVNDGALQYSLPVAGAVAGTVLTSGGVGAACTWQPASAGTVTSVAATALPIVIAGTAAEPTVGFDATATDITTQSLTTSAITMSPAGVVSYSLPTDTGVAEYAITRNAGDTTCIWSSVVLGVESGNDLITIGGSDATPQVSFNNGYANGAMQVQSVSTTSLAINDGTDAQYSLPVAGTVAGNVLTSGGVGSACTWQPAGAGTVTNVSATAGGLISVANGTTTPIITFNDNTTTGAMQINSITTRNLAIQGAGGVTSYSLPITTAGAGYVLTSGGIGAMATWAAAAGTGTVTNVTSNNALITVADGTTAPVIDIDATQTLTCAGVTATALEIKDTNLTVKFPAASAVSADGGPYFSQTIGSTMNVSGYDAGSSTLLLGSGPVFSVASQTIKFLGYSSSVAAPDLNVFTVTVQLVNLGSSCILYINSSNAAASIVPVNPNLYLRSYPVTVGADYAFEALCNLVGFEGFGTTPVYLGSGTVAEANTPSTFIYARFYGLDKDIYIQFAASPSYDFNPAALNAGTYDFKTTPYTFTNGASVVITKTDLNFVI